MPQAEHGRTVSLMETQLEALRRDLLTVRSERDKLEGYIESWARQGLMNPALRSGTTSPVPGDYRPVPGLPSFGGTSRGSVSASDAERTPRAGVAGSNPASRDSWEFGVQTTPGISGARGGFPVGGIESPVLIPGQKQQQEEQGGDAGAGQELAEHEQHELQHDPSLGGLARPLESDPSSQDPLGAAPPAPDSPTSSSMLAPPSSSSPDAAATGTPPAATHVSTWTVPSVGTSLTGTDTDTPSAEAGVAVGRLVSSSAFKTPGLDKDGATAGAFFRSAAAGDPASPSVPGSIGRRRSSGLAAKIAALHDDASPVVLPASLTPEKQRAVERGPWSPLKAAAAKLQQSVAAAAVQEEEEEEQEAGSVHQGLRAGQLDEPSAHPAAAPAEDTAESPRGLSSPLELSAMAPSTPVEGPTPSGTRGLSPDANPQPVLPLPLSKTDESGAPVVILRRGPQSAVVDLVEQRRSLGSPGGAGGEAGPATSHFTFAPSGAAATAAGPHRLRGAGGSASSDTPQRPAPLDYNAIAMPMVPSPTGAVPHNTPIESLTPPADFSRLHMASHAVVPTVTPTPPNTRIRPTTPTSQGNNRSSPNASPSQGAQASPRVSGHSCRRSTAAAAAAAGPQQHNPAGGPGAALLARGRHQPQPRRPGGPRGHAQDRGAGTGGYRDEGAAPGPQADDGSRRQAVQSEKGRHPKPVTCSFGRGLKR